MYSVGNRLFSLTVFCAIFSGTNVNGLTVGHRQVFPRPATSTTPTTLTSMTTTLTTKNTASCRCGIRKERDLADGCPPRRTRPPRRWPMAGLKTVCRLMEQPVSFLVYLNKWHCWKDKQSYKCARFKNNKIELCVLNKLMINALASHIPHSICHSYTKPVKENHLTQWLAKSLPGKKMVRKNLWS